MYIKNADSQGGVIVPDDVADYLDGGWACVLRDDTQTRDRASVASASRRCASPNLLPKLLLLKVSRLVNRYLSRQTNHPETQSTSCKLIINCII